MAQSVAFISHMQNKIKPVVAWWLSPRAVVSQLRTTLQSVLSTEISPLAFRPAARALPCMWETRTVAVLSSWLSDLMGHLKEFSRQRWNFSVLQFWTEKCYILPLNFASKSIQGVRGNTAVCYVESVGEIVWHFLLRASTLVSHYIAAGA